MIDAYASLPHYLDHIAPVWWALSADERGTFYAGRAAAERARADGIFPLVVGRPTRQRIPTIVASYGDLRASLRPAIFVEHGTGQTYDGDPRAARDASYSGGVDRQLVRLFLAPNERVHQRNLAGTPTAASVLVGTPKLDWWQQQRDSETFEQQVARSMSRAIDGGRGTTIAVSFHWNCTLVPETRSAWPHYDSALQQLVVVARERGWRLLGHGHPRLWSRIERRWEQLGVECVPDFDDVLRRADLYVVDNSSTMFEFAATAGPVLVLNAPWYRRDVEHGLRFWTHAGIGVNVDEPGQLVDGVVDALHDDRRRRLVRRELAHDVYPRLDGQAAARAADAIRHHLL